MSDHPLRRWREGQGLTLVGLGRLAGVSWKVIQRIETLGVGCHIDTACALMDVVEERGGDLRFHDLRYNRR